MPKTYDEPEYHHVDPPPTIIYVCPRCRRGILAFLGGGDASVYLPSRYRDTGWCYTCGYKVKWPPPPDGEWPTKYAWQVDTIHYEPTLEGESY